LLSMTYKAVNEGTNGFPNVTQVYIREVITTDSAPVSTLRPTPQPFNRSTSAIRDALKNAIGPTILGSNGVVFRIVLELMPPSQCDIRLLA
jgi:hypothetical protein